MSERKLPPSAVSNEDIVNEITKDLQFSTIEQPDDSNIGAFVVNPDDRGDSASRRANAQDGKKFSNIDDVDDHFTNEEKEEKPDGSDSEADSADEETLKALDQKLTDEERTSVIIKASELKDAGNAAFKAKEYEKSLDSYSDALRICPYSQCKDRAILYSNRAAAKMKLERNKSAISDCTKAISYDDKYVKAYFRRAQCHELCDRLDESLADYQRVVELDPKHVDANIATRRLPQMIEDRNEKLKREMMTNLKSLGNMILKPFGLSTENFQLNQDPESKGYSINFKQ